MAGVARLYVSQGFVPCPNRGSTKLDTCLFCDYLKEVDLDGASPSITCVPPQQDRQQGSVKEPTHLAGQNSLHQTRRKSPSEPRSKLGDATQELLTELSMKNPDWGIGRLARALRSQGILVSSRQVGHFLGQAGLSLREHRLARLEELVVAGEVYPDERQIELLKQTDGCFHEWATCGKSPGQRLIQVSLPVYKGSGDTSINALVTIDTYSSRTFALLHGGTHPVNGALLLQYYVIPFYLQYGLNVQVVATFPSTSREKVQAASYTAFLTNLGVAHEMLTQESEYVKRFVRLFWNQWLRGLPKPSQANLSRLQEQLSTAIEQYNEYRPLPGFPNLGCTTSCRIQGYLSSHPSRKRP